MMNPPPRKLDDETQKLIDKWLEEGNEITVHKKYEQSENVELKISKKRNT